MNTSTTPSDCFTAQTIPGHYDNNELNPDVGGFATPFGQLTSSFSSSSDIVINIVLPILLRWAHDDVQTTVVMLLSQIYPIMIATAGSINSTNLSLFDAHFAVAVTASPVSVYLIMSLFSTVPPILALCKLLNLRYRSLVEFMKTLPCQFCVGAKFLLTGSPNPWDFYEVHRELPRRLVAVWPLDQIWSIVLVLWLGFTSLDAWWIFWYVRSGSMPNPRTKVNDPHRAWKPFSVAMYVYGYCICYINIYIWTVFYDGNYSLSGKFGSWLSSLKETLSHRQRNLLHALKLMIIPLAFVMCCGGLFIPFAALPLAQQVRSSLASFQNPETETFQHQWSRFCYRYPFEGEVILTGATNPSLNSTATFFYSGTSGFREQYFDYSMVSNETFFQQTLIFNPKTSLSRNWPQVVSVAYNTSEQSFEARCTVYQNDSMTALCAFGTWTKKKYLSFRIQDAHNNSITHLRTVDDEWKFSDDAPSLVLKHQDSDGTSTLGNIVLQTAVTQRNYCYRLKTCLASSEADVATVVPLGVILLTQQTFAGYCTRPKMYAL
ncbi:hypothetical protein NLJ89_g6663 [Agrocybe chaxingu]|uniref:Uncharacterized protein n=1 Tax=Agrocybe chaxingu TaxID=84603 RepID=A0A9W8JYS0_9AGAR|nr:hypothetical protein NLJ89_g6663 [Agrocybe chaxingu]